MKKFKALRDKIVILPDKPKEVTDGGVYLPEDAQRQPIVGTVLAVGEQVPHLIQEGDRVVFPAYAGVELRFEDGDHETVVLVMDYTKIVGKLEKSESVTGGKILITVPTDPTIRE